MKNSLILHFKKNSPSWHNCVVFDGHFTFVFNAKTWVEVIARVSITVEKIHKLENLSYTSLIATKIAPKFLPPVDFACVNCRESSMHAKKSSWKWSKGLRMMFRIICHCNCNRYSCLNLCKALREFRWVMMLIIYLQGGITQEIALHN